MLDLSIFLALNYPVNLSQFVLILCFFRHFNWNKFKKKLKKLITLYVIQIFFWYSDSMIQIRQHNKL